MKKLNPSVYPSLKHYQEGDEFYRAREEVPEILSLKAIQVIWDLDVDDEIMVA